MSDTPSPGLSGEKRSRRAVKQKVPPFARYKGTSAWRKYRSRVREYEQFRAAEKQAEQAKASGVHTGS